MEYKTLYTIFLTPDLHANELTHFYSLLFQGLKQAPNEIHC